LAYINKAHRTTRQRQAAATSASANSELDTGQIVSEKDKDCYFRLKYSLAILSNYW
jgi:hypothetical protein